MNRVTRQRKQQFLLSIAILVFLAGVYLYHNYSLPIKKNDTNTVVYANALERTQANYATEVREAAEKLNLSYEYLMALIALETSGFKPPGKRFERHVFRQLKNVKKGKLRRYENIKKKTLADANDDAIKNLATSWGPFQLMGYKCVGMDVNVHDLRSEQSVYYGAKWIDEEYGHLVRKKKFADAFHFHNTGRKIPHNGKYQTHDPKYIPRGLEYMRFFKEHAGR